ncbi:hypothetical protein H0H81_005348 [Sphagnurus paluster]|uniref:Chitin-binding type-3 domain-containing protein n=1 Tax=Sphagnurus paluster TaxID=117069 RepID=A0A9P7K3X0_9AGAR|nr:hypothetical protein H0H81_005348 [Sphagnurus paluster]
MTQGWEPGTAYGYGDVVCYEGHNYKIIQPHRAQSDWAPPITPALWGRIPDGNNSGGNNSGGNNSGYQQQQPQQQPPQGQQADHPYAGDNKPPPQPVAQGQAHWYEDKTKLGLGIGAGALLAGGIAAIVKKHEDHKEEAAGRTHWVNEARSRTEQFYRNGPQGPATWVLTQNKSIPQYAIEVGREKNVPLYICRAYHDDGKQIGRAAQNTEKGAVIGYKHKEIDVDTYEVLLGNLQALRWVPTRGKLNVGSLGHNPVEGGHEDNGTPLFIARAQKDGVWYPGKASATLDGAYVPLRGEEKNFKDYEVLCYN